MSYPPDFPPPRTPVRPDFSGLTREEKRVLQECAVESFYQRSVPLMATLGIGTYYAVNMGYLKKSATYGALPKVVVGVVTGFILGRLSYKSECEKKILRLPGGKLKESILVAKRHRDGLWSDDGGLYRNATLTYPLPSYPGQNANAYENPRLVSDSEVGKRHDSFDSFDDNEPQLPNVPPSQSVSYDELRYRNRAEYENKRRQYRPGTLDDYSTYSGYYPPGSANPPPSPRPSRPENDDRYHRPTYSEPDPMLESTFSSPPQSRVVQQRKNFYGDVIDR